MPSNLEQLYTEARELADNRRLAGVHDESCRRLWWADLKPLALILRAADLNPKEVTDWMVERGAVPEGRRDAFQQAMYRLWREKDREKLDELIRSYQLVAKEITGPARQQLDEALTEYLKVA